jgi:uncharacterized membrane protein
MHNGRNELVVGIVLVVLLFAFANPFDFWMPEVLVFLLVGALLLVAVVFAGLVFGEGSRDEREEAHRTKAARAGYLAGVIALVLLLAYQSLTAHPDPLVAAVLGAMIIAKLAVRSKLEGES